MVAFIGVLTLIVTLIIGIPLPFAFACAFMWLTVGYGYTPDFLLAAGYGQLNSVVLLAIPLFILAGGIMEKGKIGGALIGFVQIFLGRSKSGLGTGTESADTELRKPFKIMICTVQDQV